MEGDPMGYVVSVADFAEWLSLKRDYPSSDRKSGHH